MKILFTLHDISYRGGGERVVSNLANELCKIEGLEICVMSYYKNNEGIAFPLDRRVRVAYLHDFADIHEEERGLKRILWRLTRHYIINWRLNKKFGEYDIVIESHLSMFYPIFKRKNTKYIKIMHMVIKKWKKKNELFDKIVFLNQAEFDKWKVYSDKCIKIYNFVPNEPFKEFIESKDSKNLNPFSNIDDFRKAKDILKNRIFSQKNSSKNIESSEFIESKNSNIPNFNSIIAIGRMEPKANHKGFPRLIDAYSKIARKFPHWRLFIIGQDCGQREMLQEKIDSYNLGDFITLKGFSSDVSALYLSAEIYAMSSHSESLPMVLLEAASFGLPSVAYDIGTIRDCFGEGEKSSGILVCDGDESAYCAALERLMSDEALRDRLGQNAINLVSQKFSKDVIIKRWIALFHELLESTP